MATLPVSGPRLLAIVAAAALGGLPALSQRDANGDLLTEIEVPHTEDLGIEGKPPLAPEREAQPAHFVDFFMPFRTDRAALAPDGRHFAFSLREGNEVYVMIVAVDAPTRGLAKILVASDERSTPLNIIQLDEFIRAEIEWMEWVTPERLVVATNQAFSYAGFNGAWQHATGTAIAVNADGSDGITLVTPMEVGQSAENFDANSAEPPPVPLPADLDGFLDNPINAYPLDRMEQTELAFENERPRFSEIIPRNVTVVGLSPDDPEAIWVRGGAPGSFDLYAINVVTGATKVLATERVDVGKGVLLDRQQRAAITIPHLSSTEFPHPYLYDQPGTFLRWQALDRIPANEALEFSVSPANVLSERSIPLGFDEDPDLLYFASDVQSPTFGVYCLQLSSGQLTDLAIGHPRFDMIPPVLQDFDVRENLVYDRYTRRFLGLRYDGAQRTTAWLREDWRRLQDQLETAFSGQNVEILGWDEAQQRFLLRLSSPTDPGGFQILDLPTNRAIDLARRDPVLDAVPSPTVLPFSFALEGGPQALRMHGRVLLPAKPIAQAPVPTVILCPTTPWARTGTDYDRDAAALSQMGYIVVQFNGRGAWGFGRRQREAIRDGYDVAQANDIIRMIDHLAKRFAIDPQKVAIVGEGLGGYLALRTVQLHGDRFRCAVAINAPLELNRWIEGIRWKWSTDTVAAGDDARRIHYQKTAADLRLITAWLGDSEALAAAPLIRRAEDVMRPLQIFSSRRYDGTDLSPDYNNVLQVARTIRNRGTTVELHDLPRDFLLHLPEARASVFSRIEGFLYDHMFTYSVELGELEYLDED